MWNITDQIDSNPIMEHPVVVLYLGCEVQVVSLGGILAPRQQHTLVDPLDAEVLLNLGEGGVRRGGVEVDEGVLLVALELGLLPLAATTVVRLTFPVFSVLGAQFNGMSFDEVRKGFRRKLN